MSKEEFFQELERRLNKLPQTEIEKAKAYYTEIIYDRMEDGISETEAVKAIGDLDNVVKQIMVSQSLPNLMKVKAQKSCERASHKGPWIAAVICGAPIWVPLLFALALVLLAIYVTAWALVFSLYAVVFSLIIASIACVIAVGAAVFTGMTMPTIFFAIGTGLICGGLGVLLLGPINIMAKQILKAGKNCIKKIKELLIHKDIRENEYE